ncbi:MAG: hypothetical protein WAT92_08830 [Saprospiraceae bacterium]
MKRVDHMCAQTYKNNVRPIKRALCNLIAKCSIKTCHDCDMKAPIDVPFQNFFPERFGYEWLSHGYFKS